MADDVLPPGIGQGKLKRRPTTSENEMFVLDFIQSQLDGSIHPALDTSDSASLSVKGVDERTNSLVFSDRSAEGATAQSSLWDVHTVAGDNDYQELEPKRSHSFLIQSELERIYQPCKEAELCLKATMQKYQLSQKRPEVDINTIYTWSDADKALEEYAQVAHIEECKYTKDAFKGWWGQIRRGMRAFSRNAENFMQFVALIPSQDHYLSVLCGGLKLICSVGKRMKEVRFAVTEFIEQLQTLTRSTHKLIRLYSQSHDLHSRNSAFCCSVLHAIEAIIHWMNESSGKKLLKGTFKPADYEQGILDKIKAMKQSADAFNADADFCSKEQLNNTYFMVQDLKQMTIPEDRVKQIFKEQATSIEGAFRVLLDDRIASLVAVAGLNHPHQEKSTRYRAEDLLQRCDYDPEMVLKDAHDLCELRHTLRQSSQDRAVALMRDERLQKLITTREPGQLLVHGSDQPVVNSATSFVSARIFEALCKVASGRKSGIIPLAFFCGQHTNEWGDQVAHPPGMLLSLTLQLIKQLQGQGISIECPTVRKRVKKLQIAEVDSIAGLLRAIVERLTEQIVVFVVVDGISFYEDDNRRAELLVVVRSLLSLATLERGPVLKVLMTAPSSTLSLWKLFVEFKDEVHTEVMEMQRTYPRQHGFAGLDNAVSYDGNDAG